MKRIVFVHKSYSSFPAMCTNCLEKSDLTTYKAKLKEKKREGNKTTSYTAQVNEIPICKSCRTKLMNAERKIAAEVFVISAPICWGLLYIIINSRFAVWNFISTNSYGGFWIVVLSMIFIMIAAFPLTMLWSIINPLWLMAGNWPVKLRGRQTFEFTNETYADLFYAANTS